jgi:nitroreductase
MPSEYPQALQALLTRRSVAALQLHEPAPSPAQMNAAIAAALRAPDHNNLKPWRCVLLREASARARLSELLVTSMQRREPQTPAKKLEKVRNQPLVAPLVVVAAARIQAGNKVPEIEQMLSAGAATMNLINALYAQGFASIWLTGGHVYDPTVLQALGFESDERCLGFIYVGTGEVSPGVIVPSVDPDSHVRVWSG